MSTPAKAGAKDLRRAELDRALLRVQAAKQPISISAVALEAGVSPGLIHNTYPEVAERIRKLTGKDSRARQNELLAEIARLKEANRKLRLEKKAHVVSSSRLASLLESLRFDLARLQAEQSGKVKSLTEGAVRVVP